MTKEINFSRKGATLKQNFSAISRPADLVGLSYPRLCALCGRKPSTLSQAMHNACFRALGLPFFYVAFDTVDTESAISAMRELGIRGYSLTIPHKEAGARLVDMLSDEARAIGAVNTVINNEGVLTGYNTDVYGIERAFAESGVELRSKRVLVLGAGGAARAAIAVCLEQGCSELVVWNRSAERLGSLKTSWPDLSTITGDISPKNLAVFDVIINSTPVGSFALVETEVHPFSLDSLADGQVVFDMVTRDSELLTRARSRGCMTIPGIRMLLFQAVKQFSLFTNCEPSILVMEDALLGELSGKRRVSP